MRIGCDIDEVLAAYVEQFCKWHNAKFKTTLQHDDFLSFHFEDVLQKPRHEILKIVDTFEASPHFENIIPIHGAQNAIQQLKSNKLIIITSRPEAMRTATELWIDRHFPNLFSEMHLTGESRGLKRTKADVCKDLKVHVMIEDNADYARNCAEVCEKVIILERPWNVQALLTPNIKRVLSWSEVVDEFSKNISHRS